MAKEHVSSIIRALEILECFMDSSTEWTLKNLVDHLHMPTTTVFRQISTLTERGYLVQDPIRKSYRVGPRLLLLSSTILSHSDLRTISRPELEKLSKCVKETINLSILLDQDIFYLDKVETFRSIVCNTRIGTRVPAYATSCGKIILAYKTEDFLNTYFQSLTSMHQFTEKTISSPEKLRSELVKARTLGYAVDNEEIESGLICVGAPIIGMDHSVLAAVSIAGPAFRMHEELDTMIQKVKLTAANISRLLGGEM